MLSAVSFEPGMRVLDLGCGCGVVGIVAAKKCGEGNVVMADVDPAAVETALDNARRNGVGGVKAVCSDAFDAVDETGFDWILSNPPYIRTEECKTLQPEVMQEPLMALDGGEDGLDFYRRIADGAKVHLTQRGMIAVEAGDHEAHDIAELFRASGLHHVQIHNDLYGMPRMVSALAKE